MPAGANDVGRDTGQRARAETRDFDEVETMNEDTKRRYEAGKARG